MNADLQRLIDCHQLESLDDNLFRGYSSGLGRARVYGGDVLAQSLSAAQQTVADGYELHSMHAYFLRPGDRDRGILYDVEPIREGRSFCTRRVVARQHGKAIFNAALSFQRPEPGYSHQALMPDVPGPEQLRSDEDIFLEYFQVDSGLPSWPMEYRQVSPIDLKNPEPSEPVSYVWFKACERLPDDPGVHQRLLAYASDNPILVTALRPHGVSYMDKRVMVTTLDHALWFHRPFRVDDWLLYEIHSDNAGGGRGLGRGRIFNRNGELVVSVAQEGLIRQRTD